MQFRKIFIVLALLSSATFVSSDDEAETTVADETTEEPGEVVSTTEEVAADAAESETTVAEEDNPTTTSSPDESTETGKNTSKKPKVESKANDPCNPWPSTIRPLRECCYPPHNPLSITLNTCFYRCTSREMDEKRQLECGAACFVNVTGIYYGHKIQKERIKSLMISNAAVPANWVRIIEKAIDNCRIEERSSLHDQLARFFACVTDYMNDNCVSFVQSRECEATQELFDRCHNVKPPCEYWPFGYGTLETCCKIPTLFSQELRSKCYKECTYSELFLQRQAKCDETCRYDGTKLRVDNKFNFDAVRGMLMQSSGNSQNWKGPIEHAVEKCKNILGTGRNIRSNSIDYEITTLQTCLREYLASDCADYRDEPICNKVKTFMKNCPDVRPRKTTSQQPSNYGRP